MIELIIKFKEWKRDNPEEFLRWADEHWFLF
ncbi:Uncharacterised protein [Streptococcus pseudoporcinus]|nr:Uncharacterised protein [Streptococcus pseudoporcinus]VUC99883.1 Uncharacterised protein [Streptococcus pseudoporcinus]VUD00277.1 Uncharacterised protein [Streptococcus pseudoporcinus]